MSVTANFTIAPGEARTLDDTIYQQGSTEDVQNIAGYTFAFVVRKAIGAAAIITKTSGAGITITSAAGGLIAISLSAADTALLDANTYYLFEIYRTNSGSEVKETTGLIVTESTIT